MISVVFSSDIQAYRQAWDGFKEFFDKKGVSLWVSEYNLKEDGAEVVYPRISEEKPDIVFTLGTKASKLAEEKLKKIPIVFCMVFNPQEITGSNITGVSMEIPVKTKIRLIKRILPDGEKIGIIYSPESTSRHQVMSQACKDIGLQLIARKINSKGELPEVLREVSRQIDYFLMIADSKIYFPKSVEYLLLESLRQQFPVVGLSSVYTKAGALLSFDCDYNDLGHQAAEITLKILNNEKPSNIEPAIPRKTNLSLNLLAAERLGITIPSEIIAQACEVFER
jgi:putative ABC transport system substrate-binding protein